MWPLPFPSPFLASPLPPYFGAAYLVLYLHSRQGGGEFLLVCKKGKLALGFPTGHLLDLARSVPWPAGAEKRAAEAWQDAGGDRGGEDAPVYLGLVRILLRAVVFDSLAGFPTCEDAHWVRKHSEESCFQPQPALQGREVMRFQRSQFDISN